MITSIISRLVILLFGTLYPAYASYKAVRTKNVKEYVKWMMYWIVFALFTCAETFTDVFLSWFPFYYEIKIILVIWLLSPATKGSSILYRKFVHPALSRREQEIDEYISKAKEQSYKQVIEMGSKGVNVLMQTALKGGGGIVNQLRKSYSLSDLTDSHDQSRDVHDEPDTNLMRKKRVHLASTSSDLYFSEVDVRAGLGAQSTEDISSGYSSGEPLYGQVPKLQGREGLVRSGSIGSTRPRSMRVTRSTTVPRKTTAAPDNEPLDQYILNKRLSDNEVVYVLSKSQPPLIEKSDSSSDGEFLDTIETDDHEYNLSRNKSTQKENSNLNDAIRELGTKLESLESESLLQNLINESTLLYRSKSVDSLKSQNSSISEIRNERAGRYNKKLAPPPPRNIEESKTTESSDGASNSVSAITATLVLTPGTVKTVGTTVDTASKSDIFMHSPKQKRKSKSKQESPLSRLKLIPKKLNFWHKDGDTQIVSEIKRSSWYAELPKSSPFLLLNSKPLSKSAENFHIKNLKHSPKRQRKEYASNLGLDSDSD